MKKFISIFLALVMMSSVFVAIAEEKISIVTTIFPQYDWTRTVIGDQTENFDLTILLDDGVDLHSYQPTVDDLIRLGSCDLFIYVGGESDGWVDDALKEAVNPDMIVIDLLDALGDAAKEEEIVEGMEAEEEEEAEGEEEPEYDEHVWLSLRNASVLTQTIADAIAQIDPDNAAVYDANAAGYIDQMKTLDEEYQAAVDSSTVKTLLFADRFPFRYLTDDYGLDYYAAFAGCSAESEASFETIVFMSGKIDELGLNHVCTIESSDGKIADTVIRNTKSQDQSVVVFDSMQSVTAKDIESGEAYLNVMRENLEALKTALQ